MHATQLAEVSSWAAFQSHQMICGHTAISATDCNEYWVQSKCRQQRWMTALKMFQQDVEHGDPNHDPWPAIEIVTQEVFLSEMLTRIWSAVMVTYDEYNETNEMSGLAHSIHIGHVEAKNRAMRLLLNENNLNPTVFDRMNALRRKVERWTDLLLSQLPDLDVATRFAFQPLRVHDFCEEDNQRTEQENETRRLLYTASMSADLRRITGEFAANPEINRRIANGLLSCLPADRFDSVGLPKSLQRIWLEKSSEDTFALMDDLTALDDGLPSDIVER